MFNNRKNQMILDATYKVGGVFHYESPLTSLARQVFATKLNRFLL